MTGLRDNPPDNGSPAILAATAKNHVSAGTLFATLALFMGLAAVFTWPLFTLVVSDRRWIQPSGDFGHQFYPFARFIADELAAGRLPLWNPFILGGHPFQADPQTAVFYPVSLAISALLGRNGLGYAALELEIPVHFVIAGFGTYLFVRRLSSSHSGGIFGGIAFAFSGFLTSYPVQQLAMLRTGVWLPVVLLLVEESMHRQNRSRWLIAAGTANAVVLLAGHTQSAMFIFYTVAAYSIVRGGTQALAWRKIVAIVVVPPLIGLCLASIQLIPTIEFVFLSTRDRLAYDAAAYGYQLKALPGILLPAWRGEKALYVGIATLALALIGVSRRLSMAWFWAGAGIIALMLALGGNTSLYRLLFLIGPGWGTFRDQERTMLVMSFAVAVLGGLGLRAACEADACLVKNMRRIVAAAFVVALLMTAQVLVFWTDRRQLPENPLDSLLESASFLTLVLALLAGCAFMWPRISIRVRQTLLIGLITFDLFTVNSGNNLSPINPNTLLARETALTIPRQESEPYRIRADDDAIIPPNFGMVWRTAVMTGDSPIQLRRTHDLLDSREEWRLWQLWNVKYLLSQADRTDPGLERIDQVRNLNVYRVKFSLPRVWAVSDIQTVTRPEDALRLVLAPDFRPGDTAITESSPILPIRAGLPRPEVRVLNSWPNGLDLNVVSMGPALVVIADSWHPGWIATLNGKSVPVTRVDYALRGIEVPAGEHLIALRFRPGAFYLGLGGSLVTATGCALYLLWESRRGRPVRRENQRNKSV